LSNADNASISLRKYLLESCNVHTILDLPLGTFTGVGQKTVVLFFTKGEATKSIWYYQCIIERSLGKTSPINDNDLKEFRELQKTFVSSDNSWSVDISKISTSNYDLSVNNPNGKVVEISRSMEEILAEMESLDEDANEILNDIKEMFL